MAVTGWSLFTQKQLGKLKQKTKTKQKIQAHSGSQSQSENFLRDDMCTREIKRKKQARAWGLEAKNCMLH